MTRAARGATVAPMTTSRLRPLLAAVLLLGIALSIPQSASAAGLRQAKFLVSFDGTVKTAWDLPRFQTYADCFDTIWMEGSGSETWHVHSTGANRMIAFDNGVATQFSFGSWTMNADTGLTGLRAKGERDRHGGYKTTYTAGTCGVGGGTEDPPRPDDCGTRLVNYEIPLSILKGELTPDVLANGNGVREKTDYTACDLVAPKNVLAGSWPAAGGKLSRKTLFGSQRSIVVDGHDAWSDKQPTHGGAGVTNAGTTIDWKLTLTRVRGR